MRALTTILIILLVAVIVSLYVEVTSQTNKQGVRPYDIGRTCEVIWCQNTSTVIKDIK